MKLRVFVLLLGSLMLSACAALKEQIKEPGVSVQELKVRAVSLTGMELDFILGIDNPNPIGIVMSGLSYRLALENRPLFEGKTQERVKVAANGSSRVTLPFTLAYADLASGFDAIVNKKSLPYQLSGDIDLGLFSLPYRHSGELKLPSLPEVKISRLRIDGFDLSGVALRLGLSVSNSNDFPLLLSGLSGDIKMANTTLAQGRSLGKMNIGAKQQDEVELALKLGYRELGSLVDTLRRADTLPLTFDGAIAVPQGTGVRQLPLHWSGRVPVSR